MRHPALVAVFGLFALTAIPASHGQINGTPTSVTSQGFGGRAVNGPRSSVTSLGPQGYAPHDHATFSTSGPNSANTNPQHHHRRNYGQYPAVYAVPVPYATDYAGDDAAQEDPDAEEQGGPTIFDRRGSGAASYVPPVREVTGRHNEIGANESPAEEPSPLPDPTLLVFKDGHTLEVGNDAIVGATLFDLTSGHHRRVPLADLDLDATRRQNEDRGLTFQLPLSPQAN